MVTNMGSVLISQLPIRSLVIKSTNIREKEISVCQLDIDFYEDLNSVTRENLKHPVNLSGE
jgi:hypothetical protein